MIQSQQSIIDRIRAISSTVVFADEISIARTSKLYTIAQAQQTVASKLRENKAYFANPQSGKKPALVYKQQSNQLYAVCVKYSNRILPDVFDGKRFIENVSAAELPEVLELLAIAAEEGTFNAAIQAVMEENRGKRNKA